MRKLSAFLNTDLRTFKVPRRLEKLGKSLVWRCARLPWKRLIALVYRLAKPVVVVAIVLVIAITMAALLTPKPEKFKLNAEQSGIAPAAHAAWYRFADRIQHRRYAVLTFDDGPAGGGLDEKFLSVLNQHHAHAMFFLVCKNIDRRTVPALEEMERAGHIIGNHSFDHPAVSSLAYADTWHQVDACSSRIAEVTGHRPQYFRPPYGHSSPSVDLAVRTAGMKSVFWDVNSKDYMYRDPQKIVEFSTEGASDMSILLLHERIGTAQALDEILTDLEDRGFTFVLPDDSFVAGA